MKARKMLVVLLNMSALPPFIVSSSPAFASESAGKMTNSEKELGIHLKEDINEKYDELDKNRALKPVNIGENDITDIIKKYIKPGMSFQESEEILKYSGFSVHPHPSLETPGNGQNRFDVVANIQGLKKRGLGIVNVYVFLKPEHPGNYETVKDASGAITVSFP